MIQKRGSKVNQKGGPKPDSKRGGPKLIKNQSKMRLKVNSKVEATKIVKKSSKINKNHQKSIKIVILIKNHSNLIKDSLFQ